MSVRNSIWASVWRGGRGWGSAHTLKWLKKNWYRDKNKTVWRSTQEYVRVAKLSWLLGYLVPILQDSTVYLVRVVSKSAELQGWVTLTLSSQQ